MKHASAEISNLGLTKQREVVLQVVRDAEHHLTANEVFDAAKRRLPTISFATVYNSLRFLKEAGHIVEIQFGYSGANRIDAKTSRHDHGYNAAGEGVLVKYHWKTKQGIKSLTQAQASEIQATNFNHATQDLYESIERGEYPEWELCVQIMSDDDHSELDFDPLDDTKTWDEEMFPLLPVGRMVLDCNPAHYFAEVEQVAYGTGVLVDGLDFSDDKMLQGRTMSYSDTQRYRVGPNYLQLPINSPKKRVGTNQRDGQMTYFVDTGGENPHVNYEPSSLGGLKEADRAGNKDHTPYVAGNLVRQKLDRENNFKQAGERYRSIDQWERDDLVFNLVDMLSHCNKDIQERMVGLLRQCDEEYGQRVADGLANGKAETAAT